MYFLNIVFTAMTLMSLLSEQTNEALQLDPYGKTDKNKNKVKESAGQACKTNTKAFVMWSTTWLPESMIVRLDRYG